MKPVNHGHNPRKPLKQVKIKAKRLQPFQHIFQHFLTLFGKNVQFPYFLTKNCYSGVFGVADHESSVRLRKSLYPRWRIQDGGSKTEATNVKKIEWILSNLLFKFCRYFWYKNQTCQQRHDCTGRSEITFSNIEEVNTATAEVLEEESDVN